MPLSTTAGCHVICALNVIGMVDLSPQTLMAFKIFKSFQKIYNSI